MICVVERGISRSLEGSHQDGLQNVFDGEVTDVARPVVLWSSVIEAKCLLISLLESPSHSIMRTISRAIRTVCMRLYLNLKGESSKKGFPYLLDTQVLVALAEPWGSKTFRVSVSGAQRS